jgi:Protein of unknown function (DUF4236)
MGFRMRKSIKLAPGVRLNVSKRGVGMSAGVGEPVTQSTRPDAALSPRELAFPASTTKRASAGAGAEDLVPPLRLRLRRRAQPNRVCSLRRARRRSTRRSKLRTSPRSRGLATSIRTTLCSPTATRGCRC